MRARRGKWFGWLVVAAYVALLVAAAVPELADDGPVRGRAAVDRLLAAWERSRLVTVVVESEFERRSETTDAVLRSQVVLAQRPPRRILRGFGGIEGRVGDRPLVCGAVPSGRPRCLQGPRGNEFDALVAREVRLLRGYVEGPDARYRLVADAECFYLRAFAPTFGSPYGRAAELCFDDESGALRRLEVDHGDVVDVLRATEIRTEVTDRDLGPAA